MDEHAPRVTQPLREAWSDFSAERITLLDLMRVIEAVSMSLDNTYAPLLRALRDAANDAERAYFTLLPQDHRAEGSRLFAPVLRALDSA